MTACHGSSAAPLARPKARQRATRRGSFVRHFFTTLQKRHSRSQETTPRLVSVCPESLTGGAAGPGDGTSLHTPETWMQQSCLLFMALSGLVHSRVHLVHDARWTNHRTFLRSRHAQGKASALPRLVFRYWKPAGVLSTTLPTSDGVNILQHNTTLARQGGTASGSNRAVGQSEPWASTSHN